MLLPGLWSSRCGSCCAVALSPLHPRLLHPAPITNIKSRSSHFPFLGPFNQASGVKTPRGRGSGTGVPGSSRLGGDGAHNGGSPASSPFRNSFPCSGTERDNHRPSIQEAGMADAPLDPVSRTAYPALLRPWPTGCSVGTGTEMMEPPAGPSPDFLLRLPPASASPRPMAGHAPLHQAKHALARGHAPGSEALKELPAQGQRCCKASASWATTPHLGTPGLHPGQGSPSQIFARSQRASTLPQEYPRVLRFSTLPHTQ